MRSRWLTVLVALGLALALAGCGGSSGSGGSGDRADGTATERKRPRLGPGESLISYAKVGGPPTAFVNTKLKIEEDGSYTLEQYRAQTVTGKLDQPELAALEKVFIDAGFEQAEGDASRLDTHIDQPNYDIRYVGHIVTLLHGAVPPALQPVVDACDAFVASRGSG